MDSKGACNTSKRQRNNDDLELVDRISALPDFILGYILSFLPTKDAVATSILSARWNSAWVTVHNLDFRHHCSDETKDMKFIEFVDRVLLLHDNGVLEKFCLDWTYPPCIYFPHVSLWINTAITRNVQELSLTGEFWEFDMPGSVFSYASLRCLRLHSCCISLPKSIVVCLPRLNNLKLTDVKFQSGEAFERLIIGCPMLNDLHLSLNCSDFTCIISSSSLRRLSLRWMSNFGFKLETPSLEYLKLDNCVPKIVVVESLSPLAEVEFRNIYSVDVYDSVVGAVGALYFAKTLTLPAEITWALSHGTIKLSTKFNTLVKLKTEIRYCDWKSVQDLIQCLDNLQLLTINQNLKLRHRLYRDCIKWTTPAEVPRCLSMSLKKIVFNGYHGNIEDEHGMISYMLTHGNVLEMMRITCTGNMNTSKFKSVQKISEYPRTSPLCVVKISGSTPNNDNVEVCFTSGPLTRRRFSKH